MLVDAAPRIGPVVVDLTAEHVAADAPHVLVAELFQMMVAHGDVVDVRHLERQMIKPGLLMRQTEEDVVIDVIVAAIAAIERADDVVLLFDIDVIGADEAEHLAEPGHRLGKARRHQHAVADALDVRRALRQPHHFAGA